MRDLVEIVAFVSRDSPTRARALLKRLLGAARSLRAHPSRGRSIPELKEVGLVTWREFVVRPYRIVFRLDGRRVVLVAVLDGRRDLEDLLLERLLRA
jgi:plasmid stabilization system protein ParE